MMTFAEIARAEGIKPRTAYAEYERAMRKLRRRPDSLVRLAVWAVISEEARGERQNGERNAFSCCS